MQKKIVIVGGSSGIGLHLAKKLLYDGHEVLIASRSKEKLELLAKELQVKIYQLDANSETDVMEFAKHIENIDHLIVTLRGTSVSGDFSESDTSKVRSAFSEKFWSQYMLVRYCLTKIKPTGSIILTSGIASQRSYMGFYWHAAANGAIESLVKSLSIDIAPIRINVVSPGFVERFANDTERLSTIKRIETKLPLHRLASQDEIVEGYLYLMKNTYVTGSTLIIDGGSLCQ